MAKFFGKIGFATVTNSASNPGVWIENVVEYEYFGDVLRYSKRIKEQRESINDDMELSSQISVLMDDYLVNNISSLRYVEHLGARWKISSIDIQYPRITLTTGGLYNGPTPSIA